MARWIAAVLLEMMLTANVAAAQLTTLSYGTQSPAQVLDLYRPAASPAPLVVFVHGGGWWQGDKAAGRRVARALVGEGYAVASLNYRLLREGSLQDEAHDVAAAAAFLLGHASSYGIDPNRFALMGHSAGGHLVALVATDPSYARQTGLDLGRLRTVVTLDGVFDILHATSRHPVISEDPVFRREMSPTSHVTEIVGHPLFCIVHENTVPRFGSQADEFVAKLREAGRQVVEDTVPGLTHGQMVGTFDTPDALVFRDAVGCLGRAFR